MYPYLPIGQKRDISELKFNDTQIASVCKDYYRDNSFCKDESGDINLWRLYNLFTYANKSTYIDQFLDKGVNASGFVSELAHSIEYKKATGSLANLILNHYASTEGTLK